MGSYLMALGGRDPSGQLTTQVTTHDEMLTCKMTHHDTPCLQVGLYDRRRPRLGWQTVSKYRLPRGRGSSEGCAVVTRDPRTGPQVRAGRGGVSVTVTMCGAGDDDRGAGRGRGAECDQAGAGLQPVVQRGAAGRGALPPRLRPRLPQRAGRGGGVRGQR